MPGQPVDVSYPLAGENRRLAYQAQPPYFSQRIVNSWPRDPFEGRMRGGSRPGLRKSFPTGVTGPVHLLANVRVVEALDFVTFADSFAARRLADHWTQAFWLPHAPLIEVGTSYIWVLNGVNSAITDAGLVLDSLSMDTTASYDVSFRIVESREDATLQRVGHFEGTYSIFARLDNAQPNAPASGIELRLTAESTGVGESLLVKFALFDVGGTQLFSISLGLTNRNPKITLRVSSSTTAVGLIDGVERIPSQSISAAAGQRLGLRITGPLKLGNPLRRLIDNFRVDHSGDPSIENRNVVVAAGGTNAGTGSSANEVDLRFEDTVNALVQTGSSGAGGGDTDMTNDNARQLQAAELQGKLYIVGEDAQSAPSAAPIWVFDPIGAGTLISMVDESGAAGTAPVNCTAITTWNRRLVAVSRDDPHEVFMAAWSAPADWDYKPLPVDAAKRLTTTGIDLGKMGEPVNALIAHSDDYLLLGLLNSLYVLRGDPGLGAQLDRLTANIGIVAAQAWAWGPDGETVFLSNDGIYAIPAGLLAYPQSVSREALPNELRDIDVQNFRVLMAYDVRNRGVFIGITPNLAGGGTYFWFDWETRGFSRMEFEGAFEPTALVYRNADAPLDQRLLFGCRDGHIRTFDNVAVNDDGVNFSTEVVIGPINLGGGGYYDGMILEVIGQTGIGSSDVKMEVQVGKSVEDAFKATPRFARTLKAGKNITHRPRLRGNACFIRLSTTSGAWALENLTLVRERLGKQRL